jgi:hypothetical protein
MSWNAQPFRFVSLCEDDQNRLQAAIDSSLEQSRRNHEQNRRDHGQIEKHRAS